MIRHSPRTTRSMVRKLRGPVLACAALLGLVLQEPSLAQAGAVGIGWTELNPAHKPLPRSSSAMAYITPQHRVVMFGGRGNGTRLADTWMWSGSDWTQLHPQLAPAYRWDGQFVYDETTGQALLFGGENSDQFLDDTWTWDGSSWTELSPASAPSARS